MQILTPYYITYQLYYDIHQLLHSKGNFQKLKSTTKQDEHAALYDSAEIEPLFYIKELRIPVE